MTAKEICTICLGEVENRGKIACEHEFCLECIHNWSKVTNVCPVCKKAFTKITAVDAPKIRGEKRKASQKEIKVYSYQKWQQLLGGIVLEFNDPSENDHFL